MATRRTTADWRRIELEYCAGEDSIREIADRHDISDTAIRKRAKAEKWQRMVRTANRRELERQPPPPPPIDPEKPIDHVEIAEAGRGLVHRMFDELDATTSRRGELEDMIVAATDGNNDDERRVAMERAISLPTRARTLKELAAAFKTLNEAAAPQGKKAAQQENAAARAGDQDAAKNLPQLSKSLLDAAALAATSRQELDRVQAQTAAALEATYGAISGLGADTSTATSQTDLANAAASGASASATSTNDSLLAEIKALREEVVQLRSDNNAGHAATAGNTGAVKRTMDAVTAASGGQAITVTNEAA